MGAVPSPPCSRSQARSGLRLPLSGGGPVGWTRGPHDSSCQKNIQMRIERLFALLVALMASAHAQITVSSLADSGAGTLRQAMLDANSMAGADMIVMSSGLSGTINLASTLPTVTEALTIRGDSDGDPATKDVVISGGDLRRLMVVNNAALTLEDLTLRDGSVGGNARGGALDFNSNNLSRLLALRRVCFISNHSGDGGAVHMDGGDLLAEDCHFDQNSILNGNSLAEFGGALTYDTNINGVVTLDFRDCSFTQNSSLNGGGALVLRGYLTTFNFEGCRFEGNQNTATFGGGAILVSENAGNNFDVDLNIDRCLFLSNSGIAGGAIRVSTGGSGPTTVLIEDSTFASNVGTVDAGALHIVSGGGPGNSSVTVRNSTFSGQTSGAASGGGDSAFSGTASIENTSVEIDSCTVFGNSGTGSNTFGAGVVGGFDVFTGNLTLRNSVFDGNTGVSTGAQDAEALRHSGSGTFTDGDHNLINDSLDLELGGLSGANNIINSSPGLGALVDSSIAVGAQQASALMPVHFPNPGSLLLDNGGTGLGTDQLGTMRPGGAADDIGAIEGLFPVPEIAVSRDGNGIADGGSDAVGERVIGTTRTLVYSVDNSAGTGALSVSQVTSANALNITAFSVVTGLPLMIPAGGSGVLVLRYEAVAVGPFGFDLDLLSNDADETNYDIAVSGTGILATLGVPGMNDLTVNGMGSATRSCTALSFMSPLANLTFRVESSAAGLAVALLFRSSACAPQSLVLPNCNQTNLDLLFTPDIINVMGMTGADGSFSLTVPVGSLPFDVTFSTQALIAHPCGSLFTQAFDVTLDDGI